MKSAVMPFSTASQERQKISEEFERGIFKQCLKEVLLKTPITIFDQSTSHSRGSTEFLTEPSLSEREFEASRNISEYFVDLENSGVLLESDTDLLQGLKETLRNQEKERGVVQSGVALLKDTKKAFRERLEQLLYSEDFFHQFLLEFKSQLPLHYCAVEEMTQQETVLKIPAEIFSRSSKMKQSGISRTDSYYEKRFEDDLLLRTDDLGLPVSITETVGISPGRAQEDAYIAVQSNVEGSANAPAALLKAFREIGEEERKARYDYFLEYQKVAQRGADGQQIKTAQTNAAQGLTGIVVHCDADHKLTVANCGDSRAVLFIKNARGEVDYLRLSKDHKPDDYFEQIRLAQCGEEVRGGRVIGKISGLSIARSFGDSSYHKKEDGENPSFFISYEPDITQFDLAEILQKNGGEGTQLFLVVSCDGLYEGEALNEKNYCKALEEFFRNPTLRAAHNVGDELASVSHYLRSCALHNGSGDNVTVSVTDVTTPAAEEMIIGVFDGHGGRDVALSVAGKFAQRFLALGEILIDHNPQSYDKYLLCHGATQVFDEPATPELGDAYDLIGSATSSAEPVTGKRVRSDEKEPGKSPEPTSAKSHRVNEVVETITNTK